MKSITALLYPKIIGTTTKTQIKMSPSLSYQNERTQVVWAVWHSSEGSAQLEVELLFCQYFCCHVQGLFRGGA